MDNYPTSLNDLAKDLHGNPLVCTGCSHSASSAEFPGRPSGERPCFFCIRNVQREQWRRELDGDIQKAIQEGKWTRFYDNSSMEKDPMDAYISTDMVLEMVRKT